MIYRKSMSVFSRLKKKRKYNNNAQVYKVSPPSCVFKLNFQTQAETLGPKVDES